MNRVQDYSAVGCGGIKRSPGDHWRLRGFYCGGGGEGWGKYLGLL